MNLLKMQVIYAKEFTITEEFKKLARDTVFEHVNRKGSKIVELTYFTEGEYGECLELTAKIETDDTSKFDNHLEEYKRTYGQLLQKAMSVGAK